MHSLFLGFQWNVQIMVFVLSGEHAEWCKHTNFELATHAPLLIHIPGQTDGGITVNQLTEFVDLFPTLVEAAGLSPLDLCPEDSSKIALCTEGSSLMPLISNPGGEWKSRVFMQYLRGNWGMGYSMRTSDFRYTEWVGVADEPPHTPDWEDPKGVELYDHRIDPDENVNRADDPEYQEVVMELQQQLRLGWRYAWN